MWLSYGYFNYYMYMLPALLLVLLAQGLVSSRYKHYSRVMVGRRMTGRDMAQYILDQNGITDVDISFVKGNMTDHFHPTKKTIFLSEGVYDSSSVAAIGIAAHEAGHAVQHAKGYVPVKLRMALVPVCNVASTLGLPLAILGFVLKMFALTNIGLILFSAAVVFQLVTLPVEFNASRRALAYIDSCGNFSKEEYAGAKKVLTAAALTYVAALAQSILQLLYFITRFSGNRRR
jgi:Zn-dependent membrane protease YugP